MNRIENSQFHFLTPHSIPPVYHLPAPSDSHSVRARFPHFRKCRAPVPEWFHLTSIQCYNDIRYIHPGSDRNDKRSRGLPYRLQAEKSLLKKKRRKLEKRIDEQESFIRNFTQLLEEGEDNLARVQPYLALDEYDRKNYTFTGCGDFDGLHFNWQDVFQKMIDDGSMPDYQGMHDEDFTFRLYIDDGTRFSVRMPYF